MATSPDSGHATGPPGEHAPADRLRLPAHEESLPHFRALAMAWAARAGLAEEPRQRLDLVLEEMLMNIFHHAYTGELGDVELALAPADPGGRPGRLSVTLTDWGRAFDPLSPSDKILEADLEANLEAGLDERALGGMGLFLLRTLAQAGYERSGQANVLTLSFGP